MVTADMYEQEITGPFAKLCGGGNNDGNMEDCVLAAPIEGGLALRDSKLGEDSPELRYSHAELLSLAEKIMATTQA